MLYLDCQSPPISSSHLTENTACLSCYFQLVSCFFCLSSYLVENTVSIIKTIDINVQTFTHELPTFYVPITPNLNVVGYVGKTTP